MTPLVFACPRIRRAIDAGIQMDTVTLDAAGAATLKVSCAYCCTTDAFLKLAFRRASASRSRRNLSPPSAFLLMRYGYAGCGVA